MGKPVYIGPVPPQLNGYLPESMAGTSADGVYVLLRKDAPNAEEVHELIHAQLNAQHYFAMGAADNTPLAGVMAGNLQDFVLHPRLDLM